MFGRLFILILFLSFGSILKGQIQTGLEWDRSFFWGADDSGKNFLESVEEDFWIVDAPEVSSKELNLGVK